MCIRDPMTPPTTRAVATIDIGSSSCRGQLIDPSLNHLVRVTPRRRSGLVFGPDGAATIDPSQLLVDVGSILDELNLEAGRQAIRITAVAICTIWHSVIGVDQDRQPTSPIITWADRRPDTAARRLRHLYDQTGIYERTGCPLQTPFLPAKLTWLRDRDPAPFARTSLWLSPGEFVLLHLIDEIATSASMASGTGLYNYRDGVWDAEALEISAISEGQLSSVIDGPLGKLRAEHHHRWPQLRAALWLPAVADGAASTVGGGGCQPGDLTLTIGTSAAARLVHEQVLQTPRNGAWRYLIDAETQMTGGALSDGGNTLKWLQQILLLPPTDQLESELDLFEGNVGLVVSPLFIGERGPRWEDGNRGAIWGLGPDTRASDIWRATMEGIALNLARIASTLAEMRPIERVFGTGGALQGSRYWQRILASAINRPIMIPSVQETSLRGAAALAWTQLGQPTPNNDYAVEVLPDGATCDRLAQNRWLQDRLRTLET